MTRVRALSALAIALALAGCSSIPDSGPIVKGERVEVVGNDVTVRVIARPPSRDMSQEALVRGFIAACASLAEGDETARQYLTPEASRAWNPLALTVVYDAAALSVKSDRGDSVRVDAPLLGTLRADRRYVVAEPGALIADTLQLARIDGQWRIAQAPRAVYLSESDVTRSYRAHPLYFLNPALDRLVPEFVLVPIGSGNLTTMLVRMLLAGPSEGTGGSLVTAIPSGARLAYAGVSTDFGVTTVMLTGEALAVGYRERSPMLAQFTWTLASQAGIVGIYLESAGQSLSLDDRLLTTAGTSAFDPAGGSGPRRLVYVHDNIVNALDSAGRAVVTTAVDVAEAAVAPTSTLIAGVSTSHKLLYVVERGSAFVVASGGDMSAPSITPDDRVWFLDREAAGGLYVWSRTDGALPVATGLPKRARVIDFALAPDGERIALLVSQGATTTLRVGYLRGSGRDTAITGLARVEQRLTSVIGVAWSGEDELVVLGTVGAVALQPIRVSLPLGVVTLIGGPANAVSLTAAPGNPIVVGDQSGQLWKLDGGKWTAGELGTAPNYVR